MKAGVSQVADAMTTLVNIAKNKEGSVNTPFLNYLDSLLLKLPKIVAEDMQFKIISMVMEEIAVQKQTEIFN